MRLALVGWATDSGLGREFMDALRHLPVDSAFVLHNPAKPARFDVLENIPHLVLEGIDPIANMKRFLDLYKPDTILTWEVPGEWSFPPMWSQRGIRWIHVVHWDWFAPAHADLWRLAELISPNAMCQRELQRLGHESKLLPVPVDVDQFPCALRERASLFLSIHGFGGTGHRRGMPELVGAWSQLQKAGNPPALLLRSQQWPVDVSPPALALFQVEVGNAKEPAQLFDRGDVAIQLSRFEGVGLSLLEAQARGLPVIAVDAEPMNDLAPDLLVAVERQESVMIMGKPVVSHIASIPSLVERVKGLHGAGLSALSRAARRRVEEKFSWTVLRRQWLDCLGAKC